MLFGSALKFAILDIFTNLLRSFLKQLFSDYMKLDVVNNFNEAWMLDFSTEFFFSCFSNDFGYLRVDDFFFHAIVVQRRKIEFFFNRNRFASVE